MIDWLLNLEWFTQGIAELWRFKVRGAFPQFFFTPYFWNYTIDTKIFVSYKQE